MVVLDAEIPPLEAGMSDNPLGGWGISESSPSGSSLRRPAISSSVRRLLWICRADSVGVDTEVALGESVKSISMMSLAELDRECVEPFFSTKLVLRMSPSKR